MYSGICEGLEISLPDGEPRFAIKDTGRWPEASKDSATDCSASGKKPDLGIYPCYPQALKEIAIDLSEWPEKTCKSLGPRLDYVASPSWAWVDMPVEITHNLKTAPFSQKEKKDWLPNNDEARKSRGQLADYARQILAHQHRQFLFMILFIRDHARLMRWDRVGAIVSKPFNYVKSPDTLGRFVYQYANMTAAERGFDPTATLATAEEIETLRSYVESVTNISDYVKSCLNDVLRLHVHGWPIYKIELILGESELKECDTTERKNTRGGTKRRVGGPKTAEETKEDSRQYLLVGYALDYSRSLTGRGTKCFAAYDMTTHQAVLLKDTWRPVSANIRTEGEVYERIHSKGVRYIATVLHCGDVGGTQPQQTLTQEWIREDHPSILCQNHYRLVFAEIGRPLQTYEHSLQMTEVIYCALLAHQDAWTKAEVLHCDISDGNVLIYEAVDQDGNVTTSTGLLNDWDLAKYKEDMTEPHTQNSRSGTWQFMSALLLKFPKKPHEVSDDLESFVHLINWLSFQYHEQTMKDPGVLNEELRSIYDQFVTNAEGYDIGGLRKLDKNKAGESPVDLSIDSSHRTLLKSLAKLVAEHYAAIKPKASDSDTQMGSDSKVPRAHRCITITAKTSAPSQDVHPPVLVRQPVLNAHDAIIAQFENALAQDSWYPDKTHNLLMNTAVPYEPLFSSELWRIWTAAERRLYDTALLAESQLPPPQVSVRESAVVGHRSLWSSRNQLSIAVRTSFCWWSFFKISPN
ncbi:hypothetical protein A0H81_06531 [Grifola frondosa]|uniref:Fungal-type protein kinase domain-containing protein n=1 Tax=Grifola frondosa TaxID=5627 RepID=A0A1C7MC35_GRIFR|nr:hypothetical protein A0H81_06531 [Grifola frondosa]